MASWPTRGQKAPNYWDDDLKAYIDDAAAGGGGGGSSSLTLISGGVIDLDDSKSDGYLVGYKVISPAVIEGQSFQPNSYIFERDSTVLTGWTYRVLADSTAVYTGPPDETAPIAGTLAASAITDTSATLTVTGASDAIALAGAPYSFSTDNGATWTAYQSSASLAVTGLVSGTAHQCKHRVKDAAGNVTTGAAITVTTQNAPIVIPAPIDLPTLEGWWDASEASAFTYSGGTTVSQWDDLSGNGRHFIETDAARRPSRSGTENSKPTIFFNGTNHRMYNESFTMVQPMCVIVVGRFEAGSALLSANDSSIKGPDAKIQSLHVGGSFYYYAGDSLIYSSDSPPKPVLPASVPHTYLINYDGASSGVWFDGAAGVAGNPGAGGTVTGFVFGDRAAEGAFMNGELCEVIVFSKALSPSERADVEGYLRTKWGTP